MIGHQNHKPANYNGRGVESRGMKSHKTEEHGSHQSCSLNDPERLILNSLTERKVYQHWRHNISLLTLLPVNISTPCGDPLVSDALGVLDFSYYSEKKNLGFIIFSEECIEWLINGQMVDRY